MVIITLYAKQKETQMYRTDFWTLWEKARVGCSERTALKQVYYQGWNRPDHVGCMRQVLRAGALGWPRQMGWRGRREGGSGWETHVNPLLIHVNVWQKPLQYCKVFSLQLIKINGKKKKTIKKKENDFNIIITLGAIQCFVTASPVIHHIIWKKAKWNLSTESSEHLCGIQGILTSNWLSP